MEPERKLKIALDESRLLILGAQVLFGFQFQSTFQEKFAELPHSSRLLQCCGLWLLLTSIGLLISASVHHQIRFNGEARPDALVSATRFAGWSMLPLTLGLGISIYVVFDHLFGVVIGLSVGAGSTLVALALLYGLGGFLKSRRKIRPQDNQMRSNTSPTPTSTKIEQLLTEARVIIPGAQALLGFQLIATLTSSFAEMPASAEIVHAAGLCAVIMAIALLMTPAAVHRIAFEGQDSEEFFSLATKFIITAALPLAAGISAEVYVVLFKVTDSVVLAAANGLAALVVLSGLWFVFPFRHRRHRVNADGVS